MDRKKYNYRITLIFFYAYEVPESEETDPRAVMSFGVFFYCHDLLRVMREGISWDLHKNAVSPEERAVLAPQRETDPNAICHTIPLREFPDRPADQSSWTAYARMGGVTEDNYAAELLSTFRPHDCLDESYIESVSGEDTMQGEHGQYLFSIDRKGLGESLACWDLEYMPPVGPVQDMSWIFKSNSKATTWSVNTGDDLGQEVNGDAGGVKESIWMPINLNDDCEKGTRCTKLMWLSRSVPPRVRMEKVMYYKPYKPGGRPPTPESDFNGTKVYGLHGYSYG